MLNMLSEAGMLKCKTADNSNLKLLPDQREFWRTQEGMETSWLSS